MIEYRKENHVKDKVIVITGAASGFGEATARTAANMGAKVVLAARRAEKIKAITDDIRASGGEASYIKTDVRDYQQVKAMIDYAVEVYGRVDVLVNDAGIMPHADFSHHDFALEKWEECIDTNFKGVLHGICAVYDQMINQGVGHIINIASIMANMPARGCGVYDATKVAVQYLSESLRIEAQGKIRVTTIKPSAVAATELNDTVLMGTPVVRGVGHKLVDAMTRNAATCPGYTDRNSMDLGEPAPQDLADNIIFAINQPWGVDISDITVRASNEIMYK